MSKPTSCHHEEGSTWHPAEPDVGIALGYFQCDACDVTSIDFETWTDGDRDDDGWHVMSTGVEITWPCCECCECDDLQPDDDDDFGPDA